MKLFLFLFLFIPELLMAQTTNPAGSTSVTIGWTLSPSTNIVSQTICWGFTGQGYPWRLNLSPTTTQYQLLNLQPASTYHIALQCAQSLGTTGTNLVYSEYSTEVVYTTLPVARPAPPQTPKVIGVP